MKRVAALACGCVLTAVACTSADAAACEAAAWWQAESEQRWAAALEAHEVAHADGVDHSDDPATDALGARVTMILAEAETRKQCG